MRDFIGQPITEGCFVALGGRGNRAAEYGMILQRVETVTPKLRLTRITVKYDWHNPDGSWREYCEITVKGRTSSHKKTTNLVVVTPSQQAIDLFERVVDGTQKPTDASLCNKWLHGQTENLFSGS